MFINEIDELFNKLIENFNTYLLNNNFFKNIKDSINFVKYQNNIINNIDKFIKTIDEKEILNIIKKKNYYEIFINNIKKYCAFYLYLGIGYYYKGSKELYITNIIECGRLQSNEVYQIDNFFNSATNSKIIGYFIDIKNILSLVEIKSLDKIKIILLNNLSKYESTIKMFNELGEDYISEYFLINDNFHNIIKTIIFKLIYLKEDKNEIMQILNQEDLENAEYKYIEIIQSNKKKIVDYNFIEKFLNINKYNINLAQEIYDYLLEIYEIKENILTEISNYINFLFINKIIIPISEDFIRYHKDTEKYITENIINVNLRDATKIKYIVYKINKVRNLYSPLIDDKLKLEILELFYKQLENKMAVLYNNDEELNIIKKLDKSKDSNDYELLIDLLNIRKYSYVNFRNISKDGIKIKTSKTINSIRYTNLKIKNKILLETRIINNNIDSNIVGIAFKPNNHKNLNTYFNHDLVNINTINKSENTFAIFLKILNMKLNNKKIYYWLFNNKTDKPTSNTYVNYDINDVQNNIRIMLEEFFTNYIKIMKKKIISIIEDLESLSFWKLKKIFLHYDYFLNLYPDIKNELIELGINKLPNLAIEIDETDNIIPGKKLNIIRLPSIDLKKYNKSHIVVLNKNNKNNNIDGTTEAICYHYIKWRKILSLPKNSDEFSQGLFDFVKQYVNVDKHDMNICKGCGELLDINRFVYVGTYIPELDTYLTTSLVVHQNLENINKYSKYTRIIKNIEKNIEKYAHAMSNTVYLGHSSVSVLQRRLLIKDIIDILLIHNEWLKKQPKTRMEEYGKKYGINVDFSNLFFFEIKDDIFLTSSLDTDQYKLIKYNNIIAYIILLMIIELNVGQILFLKNDKTFNYFLFDKIGFNLFQNLFLRLNNKDKISLNKLPLFCYILYYFSGIAVFNKVWLFNDKNIPTKEKFNNIILIQKNVIHTVLDLLNTIIEANYENKNYLYQTFNNKIHIKLNSIFNDKLILEKIKENNSKIMNYDSESKKIIFIPPKLITYINININENEEILLFQKKYCDTAITYINQLVYSDNLSNFNSLTNCEDGTFHQWSLKSNNLFCYKCNISYNDLNYIKPNDNNVYFDKLKKIYLNNLANKYCISGNTHEIINGVCNKCNINLNTYKFSQKEYDELEKNLDDIINNKMITNINKIKKKKDIINKKEDKLNKFFNKLNKKILKTSLNNLISKFIDNLVKLLGSKIKISDNYIYLNETIIIITHNYQGIPLTNPIEKNINDSFFSIIKNHNLLNKDIIYYKDINHNVNVYYDLITLQYLGYSYIGKDIIFIKNNISLIINFSIKDCILLLGLENRYINSYHYSNINNNESYYNLFNLIIRERINNLKQILTHTKTIIYNIKNKNTNSLNVITNEFILKFKKLHLQNNTLSQKIFNKSNLILNNVNIDYTLSQFVANKIISKKEVKQNILQVDNINEIELENDNNNLISNLGNFKDTININTIDNNQNYIDFNEINNLNNNDCKILYYLIDNLSKLLKYNDNIDMAYLCIKIILYLFNLYYIPYSSYTIRKLDYLFLLDPPSIDENLKIVGYYQELLTNEEVNNPDKKEELYDEQEIKDAFDLDEYDYNDDFDETMDAFET